MHGQTAVIKTKAAGHECRLRDVRLASSKEAKPSIAIRDIEGTGMHCNRYAVPTSSFRTLCS
jgi:hypothetical protein